MAVSKNCAGRVGQPAVVDLQWFRPVPVHADLARGCLADQGTAEDELSGNNSHRGHDPSRNGQHDFGPARIVGQNGGTLMVRAVNRLIVHVSVTAADSFGEILPPSGSFVSQTQVQHPQVAFPCSSVKG